MHPLQEGKVYAQPLTSKITRLIRRDLGQGDFRAIDDLEIQILAHCTHNRYPTFGTEDEILRSAEECLEKYRFLLVSELDHRRVKHLFAGALMDVITTGSGTYSLLRGAWDHKFKSSGRRRRSPDPILAPLEKLLKEKYPNIPGTKQHFRWSHRPRDLLRVSVFHSFAHQLTSTLSRPARIQLKRGKFNGERFAQEFLEKHRWCLERLSRCSSIFVNKYKEEICRQVAYDLGMDTDRAYFRGLPYLRKPTDVTGNEDFLKGIRDLMVGSLTEQELALFKETDCGGRPWSFGDQILDRYRNKHPSFAPLEEIEKRVEQIMGDYRPLLNSETAEVVRELILDEVEGAAFVDRASHLWNLEMEKNLGKDLRKAVDPDLEKAISAVLNGIPKGLSDWLEIEVQGRGYTLRDRLRARWHRALVGVAPNRIEVHLDRLSHCTAHSAANWWGSSSEPELQAFLAEVDPLFLYPGRGRVLKKLVGAMDTGRTVPKTEICDSVKEHRNHYSTLAFGVLLIGGWVLYQLITMVRGR